MRGKNILWITLIALMLSVPMMVNVSFAPTPTKVSITPARLPEQAGTLGHYPDVFECAVVIDNVVDLWAVGVKIQFAPFGRTVVVPKTEIREGDFLSDGGMYSTYMASTVDNFEGVADVIITRIGAGGMGVSGDGILFTFKVNVIEAGSSPLDLFDVVLVDSTLSPMMNINLFNSAYYGAEADLIRANMPDGRNMYVGTDATFQIKARNDGDVPAYVRAKVAVERTDDGRRIDLYAGQTYYGGYLGADPPNTYLYVDSYRDGGFNDWTIVGDAPHLDAIGGGYIESNAAWDLGGFWGFEDLDLPYLGIYDVVSNVDLYGYTIVNDIGGDIDPYIFSSDANGDYDWGWTDSMGGTLDWAWTGVRHYFGAYNMPEYYGFPNTDEAIDNMEIAFENYPGSGDPYMAIDACRALVEFATIVPLLGDIEPVMIMPGEEVELSAITWVPAADHIGTYDAQVTLEYSTEYGQSWAHWKNLGDKVATFSFNVKP